MPIKVRIPTPLQGLTKNSAEVLLEAGTILELIESLEKNFPGIKDRLLDETGKIRRFINFYVNEEDIRFLKKETTSLKDGDEVSIIPAIAGGRLTNCHCEERSDEASGFAARRAISKS